MEFNETYHDTINSLSKAIQTGNYNALKHLLKIGRQDYQDNRGWLAIHHAVHNNRVDCLKLLIKERSESLNWTTFEGYTPLIMACQRSYKSVIHVLLQSPLIDVNKCDKMGQTPLHVSVDLEIVKWLVRKGANVSNIVDTNLQTPLHVACSRSDTFIVTYLLKRGAGSNLFQRDQHGLTALSTAVYHGHESMIPIILNHCHDEDIRKRLVDISTNDGTSNLFLAAQSGSVNAVITFLRYNKEASNVANQDSILPLHVACNGNRPQHFEIVKILLSVTDPELIYRSKISIWKLVMSKRRNNPTLKLLLDHYLDDLNRFSPISIRDDDDDDDDDDEANDEGITKDPFYDSMNPLSHFLYKRNVRTEEEMNLLTLFLSKRGLDKVETDRHMPPLVAMGLGGKRFSKKAFDAVLEYSSSPLSKKDRHILTILGSYEIKVRLLESGSIYPEDLSLESLSLLRTENSNIPGILWSLYVVSCLYGESDFVKSVHDALSNDTHFHNSILTILDLCYKMTVRNNQPRRLCELVRICLRRNTINLDSLPEALQRYVEFKDFFRDNETELRRLYELTVREMT